MQPMNRRNSLQKTIVTLALTGVSALSHAQETFLVGAGNVTCADVLRAGPENVDGKQYPIKATFMIWSEGFISGLSVAEGASKSPSARALAERLQQTGRLQFAEGIALICKNRPLQTLHEATFSAYQQLGGKLLK